MNFIELLIDEEDAFLYALQRRQNTSLYNKEAHQKVIDVIEADYSSEDLEDALLQDLYYKNKQLGGVLPVDFETKEEILNKYVIWLEEINK